MPTYCYSTPDGEIIERFFRMGDAPKAIRLPDGRRATRDMEAEHSPRRAGGGWPMVCFASGVHASQAGELREYFRQHGCPTEVTPAGDPVYRDAQHRKRALKCRNMFDRTSYG